MKQEFSEFKFTKQEFSKNNEKRHHSTDSHDVVEGVSVDKKLPEVSWQKSFDAVLDIIALISKDYEILKLNKAGYESLGKAPEEIIGRKCYEVVHGLKKPIKGCPCQQTLETGQSGRGEVSEKGRQYLATASPIFDDNQEIVAFAHTVKDITELKKVQDALKNANKDLESRVEARTIELKKANKQLSKEIKDRIHSELLLKESEAQLKQQKKSLEEKNIALREIIAQIEFEKRKITDEINTNIESLVFPVLEKLEIETGNSKKIQLLKYHLKKLTSSFGKKISDKYFRLTPREIELCGMIKSGLPSKDISRLLNISVKTVDKHRRNIRKKMAISNKKVNLISYLREF